MIACLASAVCTMKWCPELHRLNQTYQKSFIGPFFQFNLILVSFVGLAYQFHISSSWIDLIGALKIIGIRLWLSYKPTMTRCQLRHEHFHITCLEGWLMHPLQSLALVRVCWFTIFHETEDVNSKTNASWDSQKWLTMTFRIFKVTFMLLSLSQPQSWALSPVKNSRWSVLVQSWTKNTFWCWLTAFATLEQFAPNSASWQTMCLIHITGKLP